MRLIGLAITLAVSLTLAPLAAETQPRVKIPRVGYLTPTSADDSSLREAFKQGLRELGYIEGQNLVIERRYAEGRAERLPALARELVQLKVDVIFAGTPAATMAAKNATTVIPIVVAAGDPLAMGLVASLLGRADEVIQ